MHNNKKDTKLTITGGTITGTSVTENGKTMAVYSYATKNTCTHGKSYITITGGTFNDNVEFHGGDKREFETYSIKS